VTLMPPLVEHISHSVRETEAIAAELARTLAGGEVVALYGDLGAGKTQFTRGLVNGLGGEPHDVSSPTFVLLNVYDTPHSKMKVFHLDAYRVTGAEDFESIGFAEFLEEPGAITVVEWPDRVAPLLPPATIHIRIEPTGPNRRRIQIETAMQAKCSRARERKKCFGRPGEAAHLCRVPAEAFRIHERHFDHELLGPRESLPHAERYLGDR